MQALDAVAEEYQNFEEAMKKTAHESEDVDEGFDAVKEGLKELDTALTELIHLQGVLEYTRESLNVASTEFTSSWATMDAAFWEVSNCRALHDAACLDLQKASQWTAELKHKADEGVLQDQQRALQARRERTVEIRSCGQPPIGCLGWYVRETANATPSLTCGSESRYHRDTTDLVEDWQWQLKSRSPASERSEVVLTERQR